MAAGNQPSAIIKSDWKLIHQGPGKHGGKNGTKAAGGELYNLTDDPAESHNLAAQHPDIVQKLQETLTAQATAGSTRPEAKKWRGHAGAEITAVTPVHESDL